MAKDRGKCTGGYVLKVDRHGACKECGARANETCGRPNDSAPTATSPRIQSMTAKPLHPVMQPSSAASPRAFWDRVQACEHKNRSPNYAEMNSCPHFYDGAPGCYEEHCLDCGVYLTDDCACGHQAGMSGWPRKRHQSHARSADQ